MREILTITGHNTEVAKGIKVQFEIFILHVDTPCNVYSMFIQALLQEWLNQQWQHNIKHFDGNLRAEIEKWFFPTSATNNVVALAEGLNGEYYQELDKKGGETCQGNMSA